jgi:hypothetical protein
MCQSGLQAKFCTCVSDEPLGYPHWELWRPGSELNKLMLSAVGSFMPPSLDHELLVDRVLQDLNRPDAFDTDLGFHDSDKLVLLWSEDDCMVFRYEGRRWREAWGSDFRNLSEDRPLAAGRLEGRRR